MIILFILILKIMKSIKLIINIKKAKIKISNIDKINNNKIYIKVLIKKKRK